MLLQEYSWLTVSSWKHTETSPPCSSQFQGHTRHPWVWILSYARFFWQSALLNGSTLKWPRHCQTDIMMKAHPCPFLIPLPCPFTDCQSLSSPEGLFCSIWLSCTSTLHGNCSPNPFHIPNFVSMPTFWWPKWHRKWLLRGKKEITESGKEEDTCWERVHE